MDISVTIPEWAVVLVICVWIIRMFFRGLKRLAEYFDKIEPIEKSGKNPPPTSPRPSDKVPRQRPEP